MSVLLDDECCCGPCSIGALENYATAVWTVDLEASCETVPSLDRIKVDLEFYNSLYTSGYYVSQGMLAEFPTQGGIIQYNTGYCPPRPMANYRKSFGSLASPGDVLTEINLAVSPYPIVHMICRGTRFPRTNYDIDVPQLNLYGDAFNFFVNYPVWTCARISAVVRTLEADGVTQNAVEYVWFLRKLDAKDDWNFVKPYPPYYDDRVPQYVTSGTVHLARRKL